MKNMSFPRLDLQHSSKLHGYRHYHSGHTADELAVQSCRLHALARCINRAEADARRVTERRTLGTPHGEPCSREEEGEPVKHIETPVHSAVLDLRNWLPQRCDVDSFPSLLPASPSLNPDMYGGSGGISGLRKGAIFKCKTCSKVGHCFHSFSISSLTPSENRDGPG